MGTLFHRWLAGSALICLLAGPVFGTTRTVTSLADSGTGSLRDTITASSSGDTINFSVTGIISLFSQLLISGKNLTIDNGAAGPNVLGVYAEPGARFRVFQITNATVTINGLTIGGGHTGAHSDGFGGGIANSGTLTLNNCVLYGNEVDSDNNFRALGGGIYNEGTVSMSNCTVEANQVDTNCTTTFGGGIYNKGTLTMSSCTVGNNVINFPSVCSNTDLGDGLAEVGGSATITNCTFYENSIYNGGSITIRSSTFQKSPISNDGTAGSNITVNLGNTLMSGVNSKTGKTIVNYSVGKITSVGYNLSDDDASGLLTAGGDQINTDPRLEPNGPKYNGGYTDTIALRCGSPAIDQGKSFGATADQRGQLRPYDNLAITNASGGDGSDIGAYEAPNDPVQIGNPDFVVNTTADHDDGVCGSCDCTLREAINAVPPGASPVPMVTFAPSVTGTVTLQSPISINKNLTVDGPGARILTISGGGTTRVFNIGSSATVAGILDLTIRDGHYSTTQNHGETRQGGAVFNQGNIAFSRCSFLNNSVSGATNVTNGGAGGSGQGGAIFNAATLRVFSSTFSGNAANGAAGTAYSAGGLIGPGGNGGAGQGGAIFSDTNSSLTIQNCTFGGNTATGGAGGAGSGTNFKAAGGDGTGAAVYMSGGVSIASATISNNTGTGGLGYGSRFSHGPNGGSNGGIFAGSTTQNNRITNSIVAGNHGGAPDAQGPFSSTGFNLIGIGDQSTGFVSSGDQVGTSAAPINPHLGALQNNGGSTDTMLLLFNSPAIDRGTSFPVFSDQRGTQRPIDTAFPNDPAGDGTDIGAIEMNLIGGPDSDNDGMSDDFEKFYGFNPGNPSDATLDTDGDGLTNVQEFKADTNPLDPTSQFQIIKLIQSGTNLTVRFAPAIKGKMYRLERTDALGASSTTWSNIMGLPDFTAPSTGFGDIMDTNGLSAPKHLYRVRVLP